jgi:dihydrofolate reductase
LTLLSLALERTDAQRGSMRSWIVAPGAPRKQPIEYEREANPMRKVIVSEFVTLDGVMEDPGGAEGFKHGGWTFQFGSTEQQQFKVEELFKADVLLLGRRTYQGFAAAWPTMPGTGAYGERMNSLPKYVVSTTLSEVTWNATLITGDLTEELPRLKQEAGQDILIFGSGQLVQTLHARDLIDEYRLMVFPVVLGSGKRLFPDGDEKKMFRLVESKPFPSGVVVLTYQPVKD